MSKVSEIISSEEHKNKDKLDIFLLPTKEHSKEILETGHNFYTVKDYVFLEEVPSNLFLIPQTYNLSVIKYDMILLCGRYNQNAKLALEMRRKCNTMLVALDDQKLVSEKTSPQVISWIKNFHADVNICTNEDIAENLFLDQAIILQPDKTIKENLEQFFKGYKQNEA